MLDNKVDLFRELLEGRTHLILVSRILVFTWVRK